MGCSSGEAQSEAGGELCCFEHCHLVHGRSGDGIRIVMGGTDSGPEQGQILGVVQRLL